MQSPVDSCRTTETSSVQELLHHSDPRITMALCAQGEEEAKRAAQEHVSGLFLVEKQES